MPTDPTTLRPDAALLVAAVRDGALSTPGPTLDPSRWEDLALAAQVHRVFPAVARHLQGVRDVPSSWEGPLRRARHEQALRHLATLAALRSLGAALDSAAIPWVVGKGPVAAAMLWPVPEARQYYDLDLYVRRADFVRALGVLQDAGCVPVDRNWPELRDERRAEMALAAPAGTHVDLHWHVAVLPELRTSFSIPFDEMIERRRTVDVGSGIRVPTFDREDTALVLVFHAAQAGADRLVWLGDIRSALNDQGLDAQVLVERVRAADFERPFALVVERVDRVLGLEAEPSRALSQLRSGVLGVAARRFDRRYPPPWLPGDEHAASTLFSSARPTLVGSARHVVSSRRARRAAERAGKNTYGSTLWEDVPDPVARQSYFAWVASGVG